MTLQEMLSWEASHNGVDRYANISCGDMQRRSRACMHTRYRCLRNSTCYGTDAAWSLRTAERYRLTRSSSGDWT